MKPMVSVVILTYNQEEYISQSVQSVLEQDCSYPYEIVIADDCSTDRTRAICRDYAARFPQIRFIENQENKGLLRNYVDTLCSCEGKYIADLAGDDFWTDKNKLQRQVAFLEANEDTVLIHSDWYKLNDRTREIVSSGNKRVSGKDSVEKIIESVFLQSECPFVFLCTSTFRKDTFRTIYRKYPIFFDSGKWKCEDFQLTVLFALEGNFYYEDHITTAYRISSGSISNTTHRLKQFEFNKSMLELMLLLVRTLDLHNKNIGLKMTERSQLLIFGALRTSEYETIREVNAIFRENEVSVSFAWRTILKALQSRWLFSVASGGLQMVRSVRQKFTND
ncbi:MAG: glycosyltransferase family 2 protein [Bacteroidales bacterium]